MRDFRDAKAMAQSLREALGAKTISLSHGEALELVSRMLGVADWNTLSALIKSSQVPIPVEEELDRRAWRLAEQQAPREVVPFDPARFDRYVGFYEERPTLVFRVSRDGDRFYLYFPGQTVPTELYPESDAKFFATAITAQVSFIAGAMGAASELILHQNGREQHARRIDEAKAVREAAALKRRIAANAPSSGTEDAIRRHLRSMADGEPDFGVMVLGLAEIARRQWPEMRAAKIALGAPKTIRFDRVTKDGWDEYEVHYEHAVWYWAITPLGPDGKANGLLGRPAEERALPHTPPRRARAD